MAKIKINFSSDLLPETLQFMNTVTKYLEKNDKLKVIDTAALLMLADSYNTYLVASNQLRKEGVTVINSRGVTIQHPAYAIQKTAIATTLQILGEFGCTLRSRNKLSMMENEVNESPLEQFINMSSKSMKNGKEEKDYKYQRN